MGIRDKQCEDREGEKEVSMFWMIPYPTVESATFCPFTILINFYWDLDNTTETLWLPVKMIVLQALFLLEKWNLTNIFIFIILKHFINSRWKHYIIEWEINKWKMKKKDYLSIHSKHNFTRKRDKLQKDRTKSHI